MPGPPYLQRKPEGHYCALQAFLFGDAAGAMVISRSEENKIKDVICGSDGDTEGYLICNNPDIKDPAVNAISEQDHIHMNGREVFKFATRIMPATIKELLRVNEEHETDTCKLQAGGFVYWYWLLEDYEKAKKYMEKELDMWEEWVAQSKGRGVAYFGANRTYKIYKDNPRYNDLLKKLNLPID